MYRDTKLLRQFTIKLISMSASLQILNMKYNCCNAKGHLHEKVTPCLNYLEY